MGQYANQPDFATKAVGPITPDVNINQTTFLDSAAIYVGTGGNLKVIIAGTTGASTPAELVSPGYAGSNGTGYGNDTGRGTTVVSGNGDGNLTVDITQVNGVINTIVVNAAGSGYVNGDLIKVDGGDDNAVFRVVAVPGPPTAADAVEFINIQDGSFVPVIVDYVLPATATAASDLVAIY